MSTYLTIESFIARFDEEEIKQIASDGKHNAEGGAQIDTLRVEAALDFARDMINARVLRRYSALINLDADQMPALLAGFAGDIARYRLRNKAAQKSDASELVKERYDHALKQLDLLSEGKLDLQDAQGNPLSSSDGMGSTSPNMAAGRIHLGETSGNSTDDFLQGYGQ